VLPLCAFFGVLAFFTVADLAGAANAPITFSVTGDVPYGSSEITILEDIVVDHNVYSPSDFFVHVGDIKSGSESCTETRYATVADILRGLAVPTYILPGDNEWNDCSNPSQAWGYWTKHLLGLEQDFCGVPPDFEAQSVRPENFAFTANGVLFIGLNLVGGSVQSQSEWNTRLQQNANWVNEKLAEYGSAVRAMVVFGHAGPSSNRALFFDQFRAAAGSWGKPVLYVHGDGHSWIMDRPFSQQQNILRVQVPQGHDGPVQVLVSLSSANPFNVTRDPWPWSNGTPAFNKPPCVEAEGESPVDFGDGASISGFVTDDGDPNPPRRVTTAWSQVGGPGPVTIASPSSVSTTATFPDAGTYVLRLTANDSALQTGDDVSIDVVGGQPSLTIDDVFVSEGQNAVFTVSVLAAQGGSVTINYATANGSAVAPGDYSARSGTLSFSGSTTTRTISVPVVADGVAEGTESFFVNLTSPSGASLSKAQGVAVVLDVTPPLVLSSFTPASGTVGTQVTLAGSGFTGATQVRFDGISAASFVVDSDAQIRAVVPAAATTGPISVTTPNGSATSAGSFEVRLPLLSVAVSGSGSVTLSPPGGSFAPGTVVTLTALPASGFQFAGWSGDLGGSSNPATLTMNGDRSVTASFTAIPPGFVSLDVVADGLGSVTTNPPGRVQPADTLVSLTASPGPGHGFAAWSGDLTGSANPTSLLLDGHKLVTATFVEQFDLAVAVFGEGSVGLSPPGPSFNAGSTVTLSATPAQGFVFHGWRGALAGSTNPATLAMTGDRSVDALFKRPGAGVTHQETRTGSASGDSSVSTSASLAAAAGHLYLAAVSTRPWLDVTSVSGLGLAWTELADQCSAQGETGVSLWWARGSPAAAEIVSAGFAGSASTAVIAVSRYSGVDPANPIASPPNAVSANTNGTNGVCSGGSDSDSYSVPFSTASYGSVVHAAAAIRRASHAPGAGYTEIAELDAGNGNNQVVMAVMRQTRVVPEPVTVDGSLDQNADWAVAAVEIRQQLYFRPSVASFSPVAGGTGTEVVVGGATFSGASLVRFGSLAASFVLDSDAQLRATVPPGDANGPIAVTNPAGTGTSATSFLASGACANGFDDDGDGLVDHPADPGCRDAFSATESPQCDDAIDNDGDGTIDWDGGPSGAAADASCAGHGYGSREKASSCGLGFELALALPLLAGLRGRRRGLQTRAG
jgi:uncharacterized repeat protein (TIGR02543 family)